jgi:hypothetical protein
MFDREPWTIPPSQGRDRPARLTNQLGMARTLAVLGVLTLFLTTAVQSAPASPRPNGKATKVLAGIAAHQIHGYSGDSLPAEDLEARLAAGDTIVVSCGTVARLGVLAVWRAGYQARLVGSFTREPLNGRDDGHIMMEVRLRKGWTLYDLDNNRAAPAGVGIVEQVRDPRWRLIAHDAPYDEAEIAQGDDPEYDRAMFADLDRWYRRVLGVAWIEAHSTIYFHDVQQRDRGLSLGYRWASSGYWRRLNP